MEIRRNQPEREYRERPEKSQSDWKWFYKKPTPLHAQQAIKDNEEEDEEKDCLLVGTCLHGEILEGKRLFEVDKRCKTKKNPPQPKEIILLSPFWAEAVSGMAEGIRRNPDAMCLLNDALETEVSIFWDGMKARLDRVCSLGVLDLKSSGKSIDDWVFSKTILELGYHFQGAHYLDAATVAKFPNENFFLIAVENFKPFASKVHRLKHEAIAQGKRELERCKELYNECHKTGSFPGYEYNPDGIGLPKYAMKEID